MFRTRCWKITAHLDRSEHHALVTFAEEHGLPLSQAVAALVRALPAFSESPVHPVEADLRRRLEELRPPKRLGRR